MREERAHPDLSMGTRVRLAVCFTLAAGLVEAGLAVAGRWLGRGPRLSPDAWWLAPLADLLLVGIPALLLAFLVSLLPRGRQTPTLVTGLLFLVVLPVVLYPQRLHAAAAAVLALGVAVAAGRVLAAPRARPLLHRLAGATPAFAGLVALGVGTGALRGQLASRDREDPGTPAGVLNVLLLVIDTGRAESLHAWGHRRANTPVLDSLAARGVRFGHAIAPSSWTLPSHASLFTGRHAHELSASWTAPLDDRFPTLAEALGGLGYRTAGFVANVDYGTPEFGLARGFQHYESYRPSAGEAVLSTALGREVLLSPIARRVSGYHDFPGRKSADRINASFLEWLGAGDERFFAFLNYFDAHQPVLPSGPFASMYGSPSARRPDLLIRGLRTAWFDPKGSLPPDVVTAEQEGYDGALAYIDRAIGSLLDSLAARGILERTLVVVTADHGEQFGEHGWFDHGNTLYEEEVHVPLLITGPRDRVPQGRTVAAAASLTDVPATVMALAAPAAASPFPGASLAHFWLDPAPAPRPVLAHLRHPDNTAITAAYAGDLKYIRSPEGEELFRIATDPDEAHNLVRDTLALPALTLMRRITDSLLGAP